MLPLLYLDLTLSEIGFVSGSNTEVYIALLCYSIVFFLGVLQLRNFIIGDEIPSTDSAKPVRSSSSSYHSMLDDDDNNNNNSDENSSQVINREEYQYLIDIPQVRACVDFIQRACFLYIDKITFIIAYLAIIYYISIANEVLLIAVVFALLLPNNLNTFGFLVVLYCECLSLGFYLIEFGGFYSFLQQNVFSNNEIYMNEWLSWIGFPVSTDTDSIFYKIMYYNLLIVSLLLERFANRWTKRQKAQMDQNEDPHDNNSCQKYSSLFYLHDNDFERIENLKKDKDLPILTMDNLRLLFCYILYFISNIYKKFGIYVCRH